MGLYNYEEFLNYDEYHKTDKSLSPRESMMEKNKHIPKEVFEILKAKGYEVFDQNIDQYTEDKPILGYIPSRPAINTIDKDLVFMKLGNYDRIYRDMISGKIKSIGYLYNKSSGKISKVSKKFEQKRSFILNGVDRTGSLVVRKKPKK